MDEATFTTHWRTITGDRPLPILPDQETGQQLIQIIVDFIRTPTWDESKRFLESHPELLQVEADAVLRTLAAQLEDDDTLNTIEEHRLLLAECRGKGIEVAFAEYQGIKSPGMTFTANLNRICNEVVTTLRVRNAEQQEALAARLEKMLKGDLPLAGALDFLRMLVAWLRGQDIQALEKKLLSPFDFAYTQMVSAIEQEETEKTKDNDGLTVEELPDAISSIILRGTIEQRQQIAAGLAEEQKQLPSEEAPLGQFLGCLERRSSNQAAS